MKFISGVPFVNGLTITGNHNQNGVVTVPSNAKYMRFAYDATENNGLPYVGEEVVLRSLPNGVCDTFNARTGEYVQRVKEIVLDGSDDERWAKNTQLSNNTFTVLHNVGYTDMKRDTVMTNIFCNRLIALEHTVANEECVGRYPSGREIVVKLSNSKLSTLDSAGLRKWLKQNPITVQYELAAPIITKINLSSTLKSWNTTTHIHSEIPQNSLHPILSHSNPSYSVILKPSTKYSIVANSYSNNHTNSPVNFNLGGATASATVGNRITTVTTPSALGNNLLTMSGRGNKLNNVMVIEGDVVGDEPYFEGICDVKSPVVRNVGKNLFDLNGEWVKCVYSHGIPQVLLSHSSTMAISNNGFSITTQVNDYNRGFNDRYF